MTSGARAMFDPGERDEVRAALLALARADEVITGAAITGSHAVRRGDRWSDIDLALAVRGPLEPAIRRWTAGLYRDYGAVHHWDLPSGRAVYRVFLLPRWLEADLAFVPEEEFGPHGPDWRTVFGTAAGPARPVPPGLRELAGRAWHHALHARTSIERGRGWQAEHWIGAVRAQVIANRLRQARIPGRLRQGRAPAAGRGHRGAPGFAGELARSGRAAAGSGRGRRGAGRRAHAIRSRPGRPAEPDADRADRLTELAG